MSVYENINFIDKMPDENFSEIDFLRLSELKSKIDFKLKALEAKIRIANFTEKIAQEEKSSKHLKGAVYFSPMKTY